MKYSFYQLNNHSFKYTRHWYEQQGTRRVFSTLQYSSKGDCIEVTAAPTIGFKVGYEFGYSLGII